VLRQPQHSGIELLKAGSDLVVAGYASVELVDKQGDLITRSALKDAFKKFMTDPKFRNVQLAHSNIQVGEVIPNYTDNNGRMWKSEVDDAGMFVVVQLRNDIEKAREVAAEVRKGNLRGFSIGGQAFKRVNKSDNTHGSYQEISKLELHEVTICEKGINPEATFRILKEDKKQVKKMTDDVMEQMNSVLERLEGRLDSMEKGELPPALAAAQKESKDEKNDDKEESDSPDEKKDEKDMEKSEYSDVITSEYLNWMEHTLKSAGVDTAGARAHFDDVAKANLGSTPEAIGDGASYFAAQVKGRAQENGSPSTNAISRAGLSRGGSKVAKGDFLTAASVDQSQLEAAYEVYKAARAEQSYKGNLEKHFEDRFQSETHAEIQKAAAADFDARGPLGEVMKALGALNERIDNFSTTGAGTPIAKSVSSDIAVPSTQDLASMSWEEVHQLAGSVFRDE
jgi:HK97 family phage prohead protease